MANPSDILPSRDDSSGSGAAEQIRELSEQARQLRDAGDLAGARELLANAIQLAEESGDVVACGQLYQKIGAVGMDACNYEASHRCYNKAIELLRSAGRPDLTILSISGIGYIYQVQGQYDLALAVAEEALALARAQNNRPLEATMLANLGVLHSELRQMDKAASYTTQAMAIHREQSNRRSLAQCLIDYGKILVFQNEKEKSLAALDEAISAARELKLRTMEGSALSTKGLAYLQFNEWTASEAALTAALQIHRETGNQRFEIITLTNLAILWQNMERPREAEDAYRRCIAFCRSSANRHSEGYALLNLGGLLAEECRFDEGETALLEALGIMRGAGNEAMVAVILLCLALIRAVPGAWSEVKECVDQTLVLESRGLTSQHLPVTDALAIISRAALGEWDDAKARLQKFAVRRGTAKEPVPEITWQVMQIYWQRFTGDGAEFAASNRFAASTAGAHYRAAVALHERNRITRYHETSLFFSVCREWLRRSGITPDVLPEPANWAPLTRAE